MVGKSSGMAKISLLMNLGALTEEYQTNKQRKENTEHIMLIIPLNIECTEFIKTILRTD